ncbi:hypothetical protein FRC17_004358 [Serendipita sp. 399]|nr:hypothetical protein FRC17_004358 [Serendipita sp. 399]
MSTSTHSQIQRFQGSSGNAVKAVSYVMNTIDEDAEIQGPLDEMKAVLREHSTVANDSLRVGKECSLTIDGICFLITSRSGNKQYTGDETRAYIADVHQRMETAEKDVKAVTEAARKNFIKFVNARRRLIRTNKAVSLRKQCKINEKKDIESNASNMRDLGNGISDTIHQCSGTLLKGEKPIVANPLWIIVAIALVNGATLLWTNYKAKEAKAKEAEISHDSQLMDRCEGIIDHFQAFETYMQRFVDCWVELKSEWEKATGIPESLLQNPNDSLVRMKMDQFHNKVKEIDEFLRAYIHSMEAIVATLLEMLPSPETGNPAALSQTE